ncbi:MAG TPA: acyl-CoA dehydrogenase family protein [Actinomycetota bacterium]|nr:acyl-CoA dehydrogenase family protein [Actinomycetota bacterium]
MDLTWTAEDDAFRSEIRSYLERSVPRDLPKDGDENFAARREWQKKLAEDAWVGIHWPEQYGGRGASLLQTVIFNEEYTKAAAPAIPNSLGVGLLGPTLLRFGTDAQKERFLRKVLTAEEIWCQGFSEPNAGSDLAAVACRAERVGDEFVVNGQKIWTSQAKHSDWIFALVRTDPEAPKHKGISFLLIDMHSPGIEVRPLVEMTGEDLFAEVFFTDVKVPAENLVGELGDGWKIAMTTLGFERGAGGLAQSVGLRKSWNDLVRDIAKLEESGGPSLENASVREKLGRSLVELEVYRYSTLRAISRAAMGEKTGPEASINKLYWSEWHKSFMEDAMQILGSLGRSYDGGPDDVDTARWVTELYYSRAGTIYAGTSEIQRNILSELVLELPKEGRP